MSNTYTFSLTVEDDDGLLSELLVMEYIRMKIETKSMLKVLNIVRDY